MSSNDEFLLAVTIAVGGFLLANPLILGGLGLAAGTAAKADVVIESLPPEIKKEWYSEAVAWGIALGPFPAEPLSWLSTWLQNVGLKTTW